MIRRTIIVLLLLSVAIAVNATDCSTQKSLNTVSRMVDNSDKRLDLIDQKIDGMDKDFDILFLGINNISTKYDEAVVRIDKLGDDIAFENAKQKLQIVLMFLAGIGAIFMIHKLTIAQQFLLNEREKSLKEKVLKLEQKLKAKQPQTKTVFDRLGNAFKELIE